MGTIPETKDWKQFRKKTAIDYFFVIKQSCALEQRSQFTKHRELGQSHIKIQVERDPQRSSSGPVLHSKGQSIIQRRNCNSRFQRICYLIPDSGPDIQKTKKDIWCSAFQYGVLLVFSITCKKSMCNSGFYHVLPFRKLWQDCQIQSINDLICIFRRFMSLSLQMMCVHLN